MLPLVWYSPNCSFAVFIFQKYCSKGSEKYLFEYLMLINFPKEKAYYGTLPTLPNKTISF
jgi:hypothetical protein